MKTLLLTGYDDKMQELGDLTSPIMLAYASKHRMDFRCVRNFVLGEPAYWQKIPDVISALEMGYDRVIYMDADILVTNPSYFPPWSTGFHASRDWGVDAIGPECFSMCCFVAGRDSEYLFQWIENNKEKYINVPFPEQTPMRELYKTNKDIMTIHERRVFNSVPIEVHETAQEPWQPGDWICHLTMIPFEDRVKLLHKIKKKI
jgi:hypothetical protein